MIKGHEQNLALVEMVKLKANEAETVRILTAAGTGNGSAGGKVRQKCEESSGKEKVVATANLHFLVCSKVQSRLLGLFELQTLITIYIKRVWYASIIQGFCGLR